MLSKAVSSGSHSLSGRSFDVSSRTDLSSNFLLYRRPRWWRRLHNGMAMATSAASIDDVSAMKFIDAHDFISEKPKVVDGDGQMKRAKVASVPLHVTANASIGNSRN